MQYEHIKHIKIIFSNFVSHNSYIEKGKEVVKNEKIDSKHDFYFWIVY